MIWVLEALGRAVAVAERGRVRERLRRVSCVLAARDPGNLRPEVRARRRLHLSRLDDYWRRGLFPLNTERPQGFASSLRDEAGTLCAVGYLVERDGCGAIVDSMAWKDNHVRIETLSDGPLLEWIRGAGFTQDEAAFIQPEYAPVCRWVMPAYPWLLPTARALSVFLVVGFAWSLHYAHNRLFQAVNSIAAAIRLGICIVIAVMMAGSIFPRIVKELRAQRQRPHPECRNRLGGTIGPGEAGSKACFDACGWYKTRQ